MSLIAKGGTDFKPAPAGTHLAVCVQVIDLGQQFSQFYGKLQHKVLLAWELPDEPNEQGEPFMIYGRYTVSLGKNAKLRAQLEAWRGRAFTPEELKGFELKNILGKPCMLSVAHNENEGNTYANVQAVMALPKGTIVPTAKATQVFFEIDKWDQAVFDTFSDNLKETINKSEERKTVQKPAQAQAAGKSPIGPPAHATSMQDEDIPF